MQINTFDHIKVEYHKAIDPIYTLVLPDIDTFHVVGVNRKECRDGNNVMIENYGIATYDNQYDAEVIANKIADTLGIDYIGIKDFLAS